VKGHGNCDGANALQKERNDPRSISARANQELPEQDHLACEPATRFDYVALAAIWITQLIIGAFIAATDYQRVTVDDLGASNLDVRLG